MAIRFACPTCQKTLSVDDQFAGRKSKCPRCSSALTVPMSANGAGGAIMAAPSRPQAPGWQQPAGAQDWQTDGAAGGAIAPSWGTVATGLKMYRIAMIIKVITYVGGFIGMIFVMLIAGAALATFIQSVGARGSQPPSNSAAAAGIGAVVLVIGFVLILLVTMLTEYILQIIGGVMCLSAGPESGAKGMGIGMLVCTVLVGFLYVVQQA